MPTLLPLALVASQIALAHTRPTEIKQTQAEEPKQVRITYRIDNVLPVASVSELRHYDADSNAVQPQGNVGGPLISIGTAPDYAFLAIEGYRALSSEPAVPVMSPRVTVLDGQQALVQIGGTLSYMEADEEGAFRVVEIEGLTRGLTFDALPVVLDTGAIRFATLDITITEVVGRLNIVDEEGTDLGIPGGRPITRSVTYSLPITLPADEQALVQFETPGPDPQIVMLRVHAEVYKPEGN